MIDVVLLCIYYYSIVPAMRFNGIIYLLNTGKNTISAFDIRHFNTKLNQCKHAINTRVTQAFTYMATSYITYGIVNKHRYFIFTFKSSTRECNMFSLVHYVLVIKRKKKIATEWSIGS